MNGREIHTRSNLTTRLLRILRWDYLYAVTLDAKVLADYNHTRVSVSWIPGYTGSSSKKEEWGFDVLRKTFSYPKGVVL